MGIGNRILICLGLTAGCAATAAWGQLVWSDEFDYTGLPDNTKWGYETGYVRNQEAQYYTNARAENARVESGLLIIEGRHDNWNGHEYTSASVTTKNKHSWQYGAFEMRARIDTSLGLWPAFWCMGIAGRWPGCGEVDIMEFYTGKVLANAFWNGGADTRTIPVGYFNQPDWSGQFHVWRMDWTADRMNLSLDSLVVNSIDLTQTVNSSDGINPFHQPHYLIANLAMGGTCGGDLTNTPFPARYEIDYIRIYRDLKYDVSFTCTPESGAVPFICRFTNTSMAGYTSWQWDFGDGGASTDKNPEHTYQTPGTYTARLTAGGSKSYAYPRPIRAVLIPLGVSYVATSLTDARKVYVNFTKPIDQATGEEIANYALDPAVPIVSAALNGIPGVSRRVDLTTGSDLAPGIVYTLTVNNVQDTSGAVIPANTTKTFQYYGTSAVNHPRPGCPSGNFNGEIRMGTIRFDLPDLSPDQAVSIAIYDLKGRAVKQVTMVLGQGRYEWNGTDDNGQRVRSGAYTYMLKAGGQALNGRIVLVR
jgi:beta-glucanase (GH16 family)